MYVVGRIIVPSWYYNPSYVLSLLKEIMSRFPTRVCTLAASRRDAVVVAGVLDLAREGRVAEPQLHLHLGGRLRACRVRAQGWCRVFSLPTCFLGKRNIGNLSQWC